MSPFHPHPETIKGQSQYYTCEINVTPRDEGDNKSPFSKFKIVLKLVRKRKKGSVIVELLIDNKYLLV